MASNTAYEIGRALARVPSIIYIAAIGAAALFIWHQHNSGPSSTVAPESAATKPPTAVEKCTTERQTLLRAYEEYTGKGLHWQASTAVRPCAIILKVNRLANQAESADRQATANNAKAAPADRLRAIDQLQDIDPTAAQALAKLRQTLVKAKLAATQQQAQLEAKRKRREGVSIGMSKADALASAWGKPKKINRSVYSFGVHEQWVYGGNNYLYFKDDRLDSIKTGH
jgi:hypothetical protein